MIYLFKGLEDLRSGFRGAGRTVVGLKCCGFVVYCCEVSRFGALMFLFEPLCEALKRSFFVYIDIHP